MKLDSATKAAVNVLLTATTETNIKKAMGALGFKEPRHEYSSRGFGVVWVGADFVIKKAYVSKGADGKTKRTKPTRRVPSISLPMLLGHRGWVIQPRCQPISQKEYKQAMSDGTFSPRTVGAFDLNINNVGRYKGEILAFDW